MILNKFTRKFALSRLRPVYSARTYCQDKKDPPAPPTPPSPAIAPKVIAKKPPIEELTRGRIFDPTTQTYRIAKVPQQAGTPVKEVDHAKEALRRQLTIAFTSKPPESQPAQPDTGPVSNAGDGKDSPQPPGSGSSEPPTPVPRLTRAEPERVMFCLIPYTWVKAFNTKTGVTGFWTFAFTYGTYLLSKEKLVMEHEYFGGLSMIVLCSLATIYVGPSIAQGLDKQIDDFENSFKQLRVDEVDAIEADIRHENNLQLSMQEQLALVEAKRENVQLQLEAEYRSRQMTVYQRVKDMLDFQVAYDQIQRKHAQDQMVRWTLQKVLESITDDIDSQYIEMCLLELDSLSQKAKAI